MSIYTLCKTFGCLPYPGGILNQPKHAITRLEAIMQAHDRWEEEEIERQKNENKR